MTIVAATAVQWRQQDRRAVPAAADCGSSLGGAHRGRGEGCGGAFSAEVKEGLTEERENCIEESGGLREKRQNCIVYLDLLKLCA